ncbi:AAA-like domain-containing protein [Tumidithrix elongata RA019]|uniref:AAA-like domain-containing protein n=1 Tax=Tumidithrix elongata BACA0141 TaxID=2716417 RepID=A0AAW9Q4D6_9CYAN|nr:AAA-like domain-containing protein [Tumidithrix elongata RA019]
MNVEEALGLVDRLLIAKTGKALNDLQRTVFRGAWQGKSFTEIHQACSDRCGLDHLMRNVGPELWQLLSDVLGTKVTKNNLQGPVERFFADAQIASFPEKISVTESSSSPHYVSRNPYESECYREILKAGSLIRIKAPQEMGKTWLTERILDHARLQGYQTQIFSFDLSDRMVFADLTRFSKWFCASVGQALRLPNKLDDYWQDIFACNYNSTIYFENYVLAQLNSPLVLALDKVDLVFEHPEIAHDFCGLLRGWNQRAAQGDRVGKIWKNLRLIVVHSTEVYGALDINHSPLGGIGTVVKLSEFSAGQVCELARKYQLNWDETQVGQLMAMVGGHPALIKQALHQIAHQSLSLDRLIQTAPTEAGIYGDHLRRHLAHLQDRPNLAKAFKEVAIASEPVQLQSLQAFKLESMGLISLQGDRAIPRCSLYRQYFRDRLESF